jgi:hypothetical protein
MTQNTATLITPPRSLDTPPSGRTAHLLALMRKGDDALTPATPLGWTPCIIQT